MNKYVKSECDRCGVEKSVDLSLLLKQSGSGGYAYNNGLPQNWKYLDLGDIGPEPFELCDKCWKEYVKLKELHLETLLKLIQRSNP